MSEKDNVMTSYDKITAVIATGETTTNTIYLGGLRLFAVGFEAEMTGTKLIVHAGVTSDDVKPIYDKDGVAISIPVVAGGAVCCDPAQFAAWRYVMFVSNSAETAARTINIVLRAI